MPVRTYNLQIDQGSSFSPIWVWIGGGQGVNPTGTTSVATFRQTPSDTPQLTVSTTPSANGSLVHLPPVPNFPYIPPNSDPSVLPTLITIYPMQMKLTVAGVALLTFPFSRWKWEMTWPDGTTLPILAGDVEMVSI